MKHKTKTYSAKIDIEDIVFLKTDTEQLPRMVTGIFIRKGFVCYEITCGTVVTTHCDFEVEFEPKRVKIGFIK